MRLHSVRAHIIRNSRGENTIEVIVNKKYKASAPSGASRGAHEVAAFSPRGIPFSVHFLNHYPHFQGLCLNAFSDLSVFDSFIPFLGGNTIVALQTACLQALAEGNIASFLSSRLRFPVPLGNCIGGGAHTSLQSTDVQEFLLLPRARTFAERVALNRSVYDVIQQLTCARKKTDEGAFILDKTDEEVFVFLRHILDQFKDCGLHVDLGVDIAASEFYMKGKYVYQNYSFAQKKKRFSRQEQIALVNGWIDRYKVAYVEDPLQEEDFQGFSQIRKKTLVCGDDLIVTNMERLKQALRYRSVNAIIVKPNQIGSLVQTKEIVDFCRKKNIQTVISHRSGETMDTSIAHLAAAWHIPFIKTGIFGKEREVKLGELVRLEHS